MCKSNYTHPVGVKPADFALSIISSNYSGGRKNLYHLATKATEAIKGRSTYGVGAVSRQAHPHNHYATL